MNVIWGDGVDMASKNYVPVGLLRSVLSRLESDMCPLSREVRLERLFTIYLLELIDDDEFKERRARIYALFSDEVLSGELSFDEMLAEVKAPFVPDHPDECHLGGYC